ncbi:MAG: D-aminopeptidase [Rhodospirillales bacterium]|nr:D-aminopeptidase [Rhodospirillales bacterium]
MARLPSGRLARALKEVPERHPGPGGAVAVLRDGHVLARHAWGWADAERRIPFTAQTMALVCSITKQFTCGLLLDLCADPAALDGDVAARLPALQGAAPRARDLCHNQSGLRDYWALAMLCGAPPEGVFGPADAARLIGATRSLHFTPGTRYSYANQNFRLLGDIIEQRIGRPFGELLRARIFDRAGMREAVLSPDTASVPGGTIGYEGTVEEGFRPAVNRIHWTGDAGIAACLDDMVAWERFIDATRDDADGLYRRLSAPQSFRDGAPAAYGFGLARTRMCGRVVSCHAGGLRGWRSFRMYAPEERVSIVVLFNHMADPRAAALALFTALLDMPEQPLPAADPTSWPGLYEEPESAIRVRVEAMADGRLNLLYAQGPEVLTATADGAYSGATTRLVRAADGLRMERAGENLSARLLACTGGAPADIEGRFLSAELGATLTCGAAGGVLYGAFSGALGDGTMQALQPLGRDLWALPCPRALDYSAPGDWTLKFERGAGGRVTGVQVGCWLARRVAFAAA